MIRNILGIIVLLAIAFGVWFWFIREDDSVVVEVAQNIQSSFGEQAEYVNRQAKFSIKYPNSWAFQVKEPDEEDNRGIRLKGRTGYIDLYWGEDHEKGGCTQRVSDLQIKNETIEVCNFKQDDGSEIWNEIVRDQGDLIVWANAYAASPSASTRQQILDVFSTLEFL